MNTRLPIYEAELGQSSKGVWYCKSLKVSAASETEFIFNMDFALSEADKACDKHNQEPVVPVEGQD
jgi:hypothetical protein